LSDPVDWAVAEKIAGRVAGTEPFAQSYHFQSLAPDFQELTAEAEGLVEAETGLRSAAGPARGRVLDRKEWIQANIASFQRLLRPLTEKLGDRMDASPVAPVGRAIAGAEVGVLLGWMSGRVLGQYDLLLVEDDHPEDQDLVYYVGPNVLAIEKKFAFPPRQFRLWLALHEVTHRMQFTGVPWLRPHFISLVEQVVGSVDPDPRHFVDALGRAVDDIRSGTNPLDEGGVSVLLASPEQRAVLEQVSGMMSLLEGHGDVTMDRAGADRLPEAERFSRVLRERRQSTKGLIKLIQRLVGLEAKMNQYLQGEQFIAQVESAGGETLLARAWEGPENLPSLAEIREPGTWIQRMQGDLVAPAGSLAG
jgi:coenzyme F420 biosynthesis associated uncharacterized protein